ncbi:MAG: RodZ domain-containing protein [Gallionella sp.]
MDETTTNAMPAQDHVPAIRLGATLREKRIAMGLSVADVAAQIRLAPRQIEALEADDLAHLPELPFVRGFVRSYAKLLQLDDQPLLATLPDPHAVSERIEPESVEVPFNIQQLSARQNQMWLYATAVIAVLVVVFAIWHYAAPKVEVKAPVSDIMESSITLPALNEIASAVIASEVVAYEEVATAIAASAPVAVAPIVKSPVPQQTAPAVKTQTTPALKTAAALTQSTVSNISTANQSVVSAANLVRIRLVFDAESWTEVKDATGRLMSSKLNEAGTELNLNGQAPYDLVIGNARFVQLYRRGKLVDLTPYINSTSEVARLRLE